MPGSQAIKPQVHRNKDRVPLRATGNRYYRANEPRSPIPPDFSPLPDVEIRRASLAAPNRRRPAHPLRISIEDKSEMNKFEINNYGYFYTALAIKSTFRSNCFVRLQNSPLCRAIESARPPTANIRLSAILNYRVSSV